MALYHETSRSGNIRYDIDDSNGIVRATLFCSPDEPHILANNKIGKYISGEGNGPMRRQIPLEKYRIHSAYQGIAKCHPDDKFDVAYGKRLALLRAKEKYLRSVSMRLAEIESWIQKLHEVTHDLNNKHYRIYIDNCCKLYDIEKESGLYE